MANPVFVDCPADTWTEVATGITTGQVWRANVLPVYLMTYRMTTDPGPTGQDEGVQIFTEANSIPISAESKIDVYLWPIKQAGRVRVDIP